MKNIGNQLNRCRRLDDKLKVMQCMVDGQKRKQHQNGAHPRLDLYLTSVTTWLAAQIARTSRQGQSERPSEFYCVEEG